MKSSKCMTAVLGRKLREKLRKPGRSACRPTHVEKKPRFRCPCCGYRTLEAPAAMGLCPVCWWEDDGQEDADAAIVRLTVNGELSLAEARYYFQHYGASHPRFSPYVRSPQVYEQ